jgi:predicted HicB family RNase H-like nuclease
MTAPTDTEGQTVRLPLNVSPDLAELVTVAARREGLSRNAWIRTAILRHLPPALLEEWERRNPAP